MSFYDNRYSYINKTFLCLIGQCPFQSRLEGNIMLVFTLYFICSLSGLELWSLIAEIRNLDIVMENASALLINSITFIKLINCIYNKNKMKDLLGHIEEIWKRTQTRPENKILQNYAEQSRISIIRYTALFCILAFFYSTMAILISGLNSLLPTNKTYTARYLFRLERVLDVNKYFNLLMLHGFVGALYIAVVWAAADGMFIFCTQHVCALFEGIRYNMESIQDSSLVMIEPSITDDKTYHVIMGCIKS